MADTRVLSGSSLTSFSDAARAAFDTLAGDPEAEGAKAAIVSRLWMTGGGFVGIPLYHAELSVLGPPVEDPPRETFSCDEWYAWHDFMPGSPPTLHVTAKCTARTAGYHFALVRAEPQGINPADLLLRLVVEAPEIAADVITVYDVHYREDTDAHYDTVTIVPNGPSGIEVVITQ